LLLLAERCHGAKWSGSPLCLFYTSDSPRKMCSPLMDLPLPCVPNNFPTPVSGTRVRDRPRVLEPSGGWRR
jgi:hypothetical protein